MYMCFCVHSRVHLVGRWYVVNVWRSRGIWWGKWPPCDYYWYG